MEYITKKSAGLQIPQIEVQNIHLILMSADYLIMDELQQYCIKYVIQNLNQIIQNGDQVANYKSHIAKKLADRITIDQLESLIDPKDVIFSRLYKKKLEIFFESGSNLLTICDCCQ